MHDSTTDITPGEGAFETGSSAADHLGGLEAAAESGDEHATGTDGVEDRTAADVFDQLRDDADAGGADDILADESPDEIIASADDPDPETEAVDDALLADDDELTDLLLTGRSTDGEGEFHWVDPDGSGDSTAAPGSESASNAGSTPAWEAGGTDLDDIFGDATGEDGTASDSDGAAESGDADGAAADIGTDAAVEFDEATIDPESDATDEDEPDPSAEPDPSPAVESDPEADAADSTGDGETDAADSLEDIDTDAELEESAETPADADDASEADAIPSLGADAEPDSASDADDDSAAESDDSDPESADGSGPLSRLRAAFGDLF